MSQIKQSVAWWCFVPGKLAPEPFVRAVAEAGYTAIDLVPPEYWPLVREHGLALSAVNGHASIPVGLNRPDQHDRIEAEIRANLALAERWHAANLICFAGNRDGLSEEAGIENTAACLARVAPAAEAAGVTLLLELLNSKVDHPDYQADHTAWGAQVCQRVGSARVRLLYDIYHMQIMEGDLIRTLSGAQALIGHYHTAGNPGRNDLDEAQEINYPAVLRAIAATGYAGYIAHEFIPKGDPVPALRAAFAFCAPYL
ncbi:MAG: TIM barrel protein [Anaerolineales bacterium]